MVLVQEVIIPVDFTAGLPRSKGDSVKPSSFACILNSQGNLVLSCKDAAAYCSL